MLYKTRAIVLRTYKYSETSLIVECYTEEKGLRRFIVNGVRTKKAAVSASLLQLMSLVELVAYHREDKDLNRIKEIKPAYVYQSLPFDVRKSAVGLFMTEIAQKTLRTTEQNEQLFAFLVHIFQFLDQTTQPFANVHLHFLVLLSSYLGFQPGGDYSDETPIFDLKEGIFVPSFTNPVYALSPPLSERLYEFLLANIEDSHKVKLSREQRSLLLNRLLDFYKLHLETFTDVNAHIVLKEVLES